MCFFFTLLHFFFCHLPPSTDDDLNKILGNPLFVVWYFWRVKQPYPSDSSRIGTPQAFHVKAQIVGEGPRGRGLEVNWAGPMFVLVRTEGTPVLDGILFTRSHDKHISTRFDQRIRAEGPHDHVRLETGVDYF